MSCAASASGDELSKTTGQADPPLKPAVPPQQNPGVPELSGLEDTLTSNSSAPALSEKPAFGMYLLIREGVQHDIGRDWSPAATSPGQRFQFRNDQKTRIRRSP